MMMQYFTALVKPASSLCNLRCAYCFYHDVAENRAVPSYGIMTQGTVTRMLERIAAFVKTPTEVTFLFQGGEPTMAGLPFYERFAEQCAVLFPRGIQVRYSIQTNGTQLDDAWCAFFRAHGFLVGLSWDGPGEIHDLNRVDVQQKGTFAAVKRAASLLHTHGVEYNVLCVVTKAAARHPQELFRFFRRQQCKHLQLIPCLAPLGASEPRAFTLTPRLYGDFLIRMFTLWLEASNRGEEIHIRTFENLLLLLQGRPAEQCGAMGFCTAQFVVEADGSVYPCDFYVLDAYRCGNVHTHTVEELRESPGLRAFMNRQEPKPGNCSGCAVAQVCGGGCKRSRAFYGEEAGYCPQEAFLQHALRLLSAKGRTGGVHK